MLYQEKENILKNNLISEKLNLDTKEKELCELNYKFIINNDPTIQLKIKSYHKQVQEINIHICDRTKIIKEMDKIQKERNFILQFPEDHKNEKLSNLLNKHDKHFQKLLELIKNSSDNNIQQFITEITSIPVSINNNNDLSKIKNEIIELIKKKDTYNQEIISLEHKKRVISKLQSQIALLNEEINNIKCVIKKKTDKINKLQNMKLVKSISDIEEKYREPFADRIAGIIYCSGFDSPSQYDINVMNINKKIKLVNICDFDNNYLYNYPNYPRDNSCELLNIGNEYLLGEFIENHKFENDIIL